MKYKVEFEIESDSEWNDSSYLGLKRLVVDPKIAHGIVRVPDYAKIEKIETPVPVGSVYRAKGPHRSYVWIKTNVGWKAVDLHTGCVSYTSIVDDNRWRNPRRDEEAW